MGRLFSGYLKLGVLGVWMTFKKVEMKKTLRNGLSMIETNTLIRLKKFTSEDFTSHFFQKSKNLTSVSYTHRIVPYENELSECWST